MNGRRHSERDRHSERSEESPARHRHSERSEESPPPFFILTGGPGSGKTTMIEALTRRGYPCMDEAGRRVIKEQLAIQGDALPWMDKKKFLSAMLAYDVRSFQTAPTTGGGVFFDRGIPDLVGYARLEQLAIPDLLKAALNRHRYNEPVFIAPPWREIYQADTERKQTFGVAVATYDALVKAYEECGYRLIEVPKVSVEERVGFILAKIGSSTI